LTLLLLLLLLLSQLLLEGRYQLDLLLVGRAQRELAQPLRAEVEPAEVAVGLRSGRGVDFLAAAAALRQLNN